MITFIFGVISVYLVLRFKELIQAIIFHVVSNTLAVMQILKIGFFSQAGEFTMQGVASSPVMIGAVIIGYYALKKQGVLT